MVKGKNYVHVRVQQRNGRKSLTTVQARADTQRTHHSDTTRLAPTARMCRFRL